VGKDRRQEGVGKIRENREENRRTMTEAFIRIHVYFGAKFRKLMQVDQE